MASTYRIHINNPDGTTSIAEVIGTRFTHYVENIAHSFFVHKELHNQFSLKVSHLDSGRGVCNISQLSRQAALGDDVGAAKLELKKLIDKFGAPRIRSVLAGAPDLPPRKKSRNPVASKKAARPTDEAQ